MTFRAPIPRFGAIVSAVAPSARPGKATLVYLVQA